jgi:hypothetical protein
VSKTFALKFSQFVTFPSVEESHEIARSFHEEFGFPPVIAGIIDGTHIRICKPTASDPRPEKFFNRKGFYSINCMCVVDHTGKFRYVTSRHCGSTHDAKAFGQSYLRANLVSRFDPKFPLALLGDEGYGCEDVLLTPVRQRQLDAERNEDLKEKMKKYNHLHRSTRVKVEHGFGIIKKRFPVLLYQIRCRKIENVQSLISAAFVIHNFLIDINEPVFYSG